MLRLIILAAFLLLGIAYYYLFGPGPTPSEMGELPWWRPRGWALRWESLSMLKELREADGAARLLADARESRNRRRTGIATGARPKVFWLAIPPRAQATARVRSVRRSHPGAVSTGEGTEPAPVLRQGPGSKRGSPPSCWTAFAVESF